MNPPDTQARIREAESFPIRALQTVIRVRGEDTDGSLSVIEHVIPTGTVSMPVHTHSRETETLFVQEGTLTVKAGGRVARHGAGTWLVLPAGVPHTVWNTSGQPVRFLTLFSPAGIEKYYEEVSALIPVTGTVPMERVVEASRRYGLEFDMPSLLDIIERYDVKLV